MTSSVRRVLFNFCVISIGNWNLEGKDSVLCVHDGGKGYELCCPEQLSYIGVGGVFTRVEVGCHRLWLYEAEHAGQPGRLRHQRWSEMVCKAFD